MTPEVSFVVPCYKLAHLLPECVTSVLSQSYENFELIIMDDCSPDSTTDVVHSFRDSRVRYTRNPTNLGHIRNYNKGIAAARGRYVWLLSADDVLWSPSVLERYVEVLTREQRAGYAVCAGVELKSSGIASPALYTVLAEQDTVMSGSQLLQTLAYSNSILASAPLVRSALYRDVQGYPEDLPYAADWYMWCLLAMHHDVAFLREPMVAYRIHGASMTDQMISGSPEQCLRDDVAVLYRLYQHAVKCRPDLANLFLNAMARQYAHQLLGKRYRSGRFQITMVNIDESMSDLGLPETARRGMRARVLAAVGDEEFKAGDEKAAAASYSRALAEGGWTLNIWMKKALLSRGGFGRSVRTLYAGRRRRSNA